jgi:UDP-3-O-[3-hydroxymyristoyl] glucosamine N-acyltransferase
VLQYFEVTGGKIPLAKLPDVNNVSIQDQYIGLNTTEISTQFLCMTTISSKVYIGDNSNIYFPSFVQ